MGFFDKIKAGLDKTKQAFVDTVSTVFAVGKPIDEELFEELEEALIQADVGVPTAVKLVDTLRTVAKEKKLTEAQELSVLLEEEITNILKEGSHELLLDDDKVNVILMVGVNGVGKTTSIGKLSNILKQQGHRVLVAAADTFRAGAIDQLKVWCQRSGVDLIQHQEGADPGAVVFDAIQAGKSRGSNVLIVDTAGRLQNKTNLMEELKKIKRIIDRELPDTTPEVLLTLDATTGQNALSQAKLFTEAVGVNGVILTKLDGTAKGGVIIGVQDEFFLPVKFIGVGEKIDDLQVFDPETFSKALFEKGE